MFRPEVRKILAHANVPPLQKQAAERRGLGAQDSAIPLVHANATYQHAWHEKVGDEEMEVRYYAGR